MGSRSITELAFAGLIAALIALEVLASRGVGRIPTLRTLIGRAMRSRSGRVGILAGWAWLGLHFFAR